MKTNCKNCETLQEVKKINAQRYFILYLCGVFLVPIFWLAFLGEVYLAEKRVFDSCYDNGSFIMSSTGWKMKCEADMDSMMVNLEDPKRDIEK